MVIGARKRDALAYLLFQFRRSIRPAIIDSITRQSSYTLYEANLIVDSFKTLIPIQPSRNTVLVMGPYFRKRVLHQFLDRRVPALTNQLIGQAVLTPHSMGIFREQAMKVLRKL